MLGLQTLDSHAGLSLYPSLGKTACTLLGSSTREWECTVKASL